MQKVLLQIVGSCMFIIATMLHVINAPWHKKMIEQFLCGTKYSSSTQLNVPSMRKYVLLTALLLCRTVLSAQVPLFKSDSEAISTIAFNKNVAARIFACVYLVDNYLDLEKLDSSQYWLNKAIEINRTNNFNFFNYLLQTRQSEIDYYSNLLSLGAESSRKSLVIAKTINDSMCIADANHFIALILQAQDSSAKAVIYFKAASIYSHSIKRQPFYQLLIKPYNITNNLAKAYINLSAFDKALLELGKSFKELDTTKPNRGLANYYYLLGKLHFKQGKTDTALKFYHAGLTVAKKIANLDVELSIYHEKALCYKSLNDLPAALEEIKKGFELFKRNIFINARFSKDFFQTALHIYIDQKNSKGIIASYAKLSFIDSINSFNNTRQSQYILASNTNTENRLLKLQIADALKQQKLSATRLIIVLLCTSLLAGIAFAMWYFTRQQLKVFKLKSTISQSLHDDIGASLSSIHIFGELAYSLWDTKPQQSKEMVKKIFRQSKEVMTTMNDIVWGLKPAENEQNSLSMQLKNFSQDFLTLKNIKTDFYFDENILKKIRNPKVRTNLLLISKETINNIAKYSNATHAAISLHRENNEIVLAIKDNGRGFDKSLTVRGNGLGNIVLRCDQLKGECTIDAVAGGVFA